MAGDAGLAGEEAVAELRVVAVRVEQYIRQVRLFVPYRGPGVYTIPGQDGSVTVTVYGIG
ncbi:hypothetical protein G5C65_20855 [Streptomyces sp. SB3404]|uniref:Uncharacterized protein n=1 Tax=Streptomyces boncukensis TaxID=2711219 RepID=A0A6G4X1M3_9ACTN|nr:hypothetical protein [Streptomyces boncukensis]NGO70757.1 hypothetical protein [Streptomyces boncukensis]